MIAELKSELRKLVSVRATYGILAVSLLLMGIFAFWANGVKVDPKALQSPSFLQGQIVEGVSALGLIGAFAGVLLVTYEYRYNLIMYSLTASSRRYKVLLAKLLVVSAYALIYTAAMAVLTVLFVQIGVAIQGANMAAQEFVYSDFVWRIFFYGWGFAMIGLAIGFLVRNQIFAFATLLILPGLVEQLLALVLKNNQIYLPFRALDAVIHPGSGSHVLTSFAGAMVFLVYLVVAWIAALILFQKRDAN